MYKASLPVSYIATKVDCNPASLRNWIRHHKQEYEDVKPKFTDTYEISNGHGYKGGYHGKED